MVISAGIIQNESPDLPGNRETAFYPSSQESEVGPVSRIAALRAAIVRIANQEWRRWNDGGKKFETDPRVRSILRDYWLNGAGNNFSEADLGNPQFQNTWPWSATFISWVMKKAGAGNDFKYAAAHTIYIKAARDNRLANNSNPFKAFRIREVIPEPGDLVCINRSAVDVNYDNIDPNNKQHKTHCDIVTEAVFGKITTIGGNLSNSVSKTLVKTDERGHIKAPNYFAVIKLVSPQLTTPAASTLPSASIQSSSPVNLEELRRLSGPDIRPTVNIALRILKCICAYHSIPWRVAYVLLEHEGGIRYVRHPDGVMQITRPTRQTAIPRIPRPLKLAILGLAENDATSDAVLSGAVSQAFPLRLAVQIAAGIQELKDRLDQFSGYVALAYQAYNAGAGSACLTATGGKSRRKPPSLAPPAWENMCRFGASLLHQPPEELRIEVGTWQCDANIPAWFTHIPVYDRRTGLQLLAYKYLRSITEQVKASKPAFACDISTHARRDSGSGPIVRKLTRYGALDKLFNPARLGLPYREAVKGEFKPVIDDGRPVKIYQGRLVKMPLASSGQAN
jgi:hypothetical protein